MYETGYWDDEEKCIKPFVEISMYGCSKRERLTGNAQGTNMGLDNISHGIEIGIERIKIVNEMTKLLTFADTKEDFQYILERMCTELEEGITEIDQMLSQNEEGTL